MYLNTLEWAVSRYSGNPTFGIGVCFHIGQSDKVLSTKDWENSTDWCLIFVRQMRIIPYCWRSSRRSCPHLEKKKKMSDKGRELKNFIIAAWGSFGNPYYKGSSSSAWDRFFPLPSRVPLNQTPLILKLARGWKGPFGNSQSINLHFKILTHISRAQRTFKEGP